MVGMTTVFIILSLVVLSGNILIRVLNGLGFVLNEDQLKASKAASAAAATAGAAALANAQAAALPASKEAAIEKAIQQWSGGKAGVKKITKIWN